VVPFRGCWTIWVVSIPVNHSVCNENTTLSNFILYITSLIVIFSNHRLYINYRVLDFLNHRLYTAFRILIFSDYRLYTNCRVLTFSNYRLHTACRLATFSDHRLCIPSVLSPKCGVIHKKNTGRIASFR